MSNSSTTETAPLAFDPYQVLLDPKTIPKRIASKCKQILLNKSPVFTKTCWNRHFGGNSSLCYSAIRLLIAAELLLEGNFAANGIKGYISWMKTLPTDTTDSTITLNFQQTKLNMFEITWHEYASSFQQIEFGHSKTSTLVSDEAAKILRSKPYRDVGFILNEEIVLMKNNKSNVHIIKEKSTVLKFICLDPSIIKEHNLMNNFNVDSPEPIVHEIIDGKI
jgi:hypothetical protein